MWLLEQKYKHSYITHKKLFSRVNKHLRKKEYTSCNTQCKETQYIIIKRYDRVDTKPVIINASEFVTY